jgi:hypothetical protein
MLALRGAARRWEPLKLRLRLFTARRIVRGSRRLRLRLAAPVALGQRDHAGIARLQALAPV